MTAATPRDRAHDELARAVAAATGAGAADVAWLGPEEGAPAAARDRAAPVVVLDGVLEQVPDAAVTLRQLASDRVLAEDGTLILDIRNARHDAVVAELLSGAPAGTGSGLLDRRQRSWFTLESLRDLLESTGFVLTEVHRVRHRAVGGPAPASGAGVGEVGDVESYVVLARRAGAAARLAELTARLAVAGADAEACAGEVAAAAHRLAAVQALLGEERAEHARLVEAGRKELVALRAENAELTTRLEAAGRALTEARAASASAPAPAPAPTAPSPAHLVGERVSQATTSIRSVGARVRSGLAGTRRRSP